jgi:hypothetical protein
MSKRLAVPSKDLELVVVGPLGNFKASRVQKLSLGKDIPNTVVDELGNSSHVGTTKDTPNVTLTFSAFDVGIKMFAALTGTSSTAYPGAGVDIVNLGQMDAVLFVKDDLVATYAKTAHAHALQITQFTFNYSVDGESTEDYTAIGSTHRWLKYDVVVDKFTTGTSFTLSQTPIQTASGSYALSVIADSAYLLETSSVPTAGYYRLNGSGNKTLTLGTAAAHQVVAVYHSNDAGAWTDVSDALLPIAIKGKDVSVQILANSIPRVQSVSITGNLNATAVKEMGNKDTVGYQRQVPTITGSLTVLDTDTELISLLTNGSITSSGVNEWQPGEGCTTTPISLLIELLDPCDTTLPYTVMKSVYLPSITIVGDAYSDSVNGNAQEVFNWQSADAHCIVYSGAPS